MQKDSINNVHISSEQVLITPAELKAKLPVSEKALQFVQDARGTISDIIHGKDHRLLIVCGPCSVHDLDAAKEYAYRLKKLHDEYKDTLYIVMRVYFEKPRTTVGWKGFINDPHMDNSFDVETGLHLGRELLAWIAELELPVATEALDPISPQYLAELFSWSAIGARTTESQTHREMASGLSMPVGFKNGTDGSLATAINAAQSAAACWLATARKKGRTKWPPFRMICVDVGRSSFVTRRGAARLFPCEDGGDDLSPATAGHARRTVLRLAVGLQWSRLLAQ